MTDLGKVLLHLGITVDFDRKKSEIILSQTVFFKKVFNRFNMQVWRSVSTPLELNTGNLFWRGDQQADKETIIWY